MKCLRVSSASPEEHRGQYEAALLLHCDLWSSPSSSSSSLPESASFSLSPRAGAWSGKEACRLERSQGPNTFELLTLPHCFWARTPQTHWFVVKENGMATARRP